MAIRTATATVGTYARVSKPSTTHATSGKLRLVNDSGEARAYVRFVNPKLPDDTVISAWLEFTPTADWDATTKRFQRVKFPAGRTYANLTWNNKPPAWPGSPVMEVAGGGTSVWIVPVTHIVATGVSLIDIEIGSETTQAQSFWGVSGTTPPRLVVEVAVPAGAPVNLAPDGNISVAAPVVTWSPPAEVDAAQVEIGAVSDAGVWTATEWASGEILTSEGTVDLAAEGWAGVPVGASRAIRVRHRVDEVWGDWAIVEITRVAKPPVTLTNPGASNADPTPPMTWTFPGQEAWQIIVSAGGKVLGDTGKRAGDDASYTPVSGAKVPGESVTRELRVWDGVLRAASPGDPAYASVSRVTQWVPGPIAAPVITVTQLDQSPGITLTTSTVTDEVIWYRGGLEVARVPGTGSYVDWTAPPNVAATYTARAVINGEAGAESAPVVVRPIVTGLWAVDPETGIRFSLAGDSLAYAMGSSTQQITPLNASRLFAQHFALRGAEGTMEGQLHPVGDDTLDGYVAAVEWMRENPASEFRVAFGDSNFAVEFAEIFWRFDPTSTSHNDIRKNAVFTFFQTDWKPRYA